MFCRALKSPSQQVLPPYCTCVGPSLNSDNLFVSAKAEPSNFLSTVAGFGWSDGCRPHRFYALILVPLTFLIGSQLTYG